MPSSEKIMAFLLRIGFTMLGLLIANEMIAEIIARMSFTAGVFALIGLILVSPIAYFIRESGRERSGRPSRRGAERTPLLPPHEEH